MKKIKLIGLYFCNYLPKNLKWRLYSISFFKRRLKINFTKVRENLFAKSTQILIIGANDGLSFDDTFQEIHPNKVSGVVVEPSKKYFHLLKENLKGFSKLKFLNVAISNSNDRIKLYQLNENGIKKMPSWGKGLGSFSKNHLLKFESIIEDDIEVESVEGKTFCQLCTENLLFNVDYLQIDTEGFDAEIIKMIDFKNFSVKLLKFEWTNLNQVEIMEVIMILENQGFVCNKLAEDMVCYSKSINPVFI